MSHELNLAITLPADPLLLAAPIMLVIVLLLALKVLGKRRSKKKGKVTGLAMASIELGIDLDPLGTDRGPVAQGKVNNHVVSVATLSGKGRKNKATTDYLVRYEAPEAPKFTLTKRVDKSVPTLDTDSPEFDAAIAVVTDQPTLFARFMTSSRRAAVLRMLEGWPKAEITNREIRLSTKGIEDDGDVIVDAVCHLVATAEVFDRPSVRTAPVPPVGVEAPVEVAAAEQAPTHVPADVVAETPAHAVDEPREMVATVAPELTPVVESAPAAPVDEDAPAELDDLVAAAQAIYDAGTQPDNAANIDSADSDTSIEAPIPVVGSGVESHAEIHGETDILTEVRLDEATVLNDLFNSGLDEAGTTARFAQVYQGREVSWTGEVLRLGPTDKGLQRIAAFVGSANGQNPESGRVVALTAVSPEPVLAPGDVVAFNGTLVNLDTKQRLFHVV